MISRNLTRARAFIKFERLFYSSVKKIVINLQIELHERTSRSLNAARMQQPRNDQCKKNRILIYIDKLNCNPFIATKS